MSLLSIDLDAIAANWCALQRHVGAAVSVSAVIKANAYGLGASRVGPALYGAGCRHFFLATTVEAVAAREYLAPDAYCYVLHGVAKGDEALFAQHNLIPVLSSLEAVKRWAKWRGALSVSAAELPCVIKMDTGMTRLGLTVAALEHLCLDSGSLIQANPVMFMSHLACSDEPESEQNAVQLSAFKKAAVTVREILPGIQLSLANSSGIFLGANYHQSLVRPGAALYGIQPAAGMDSPMLQVVSLTLPIIQLREISGPVRVGYGARGEAHKGQILAVVSGGYADGLHRVLGEAGIGICAGVQVPVVGRISMDAVTFDVTHVPGIQKQLGADAAQPALSIEVIGKALSLSAIARRNHSLGYEVLSSLTCGRYTRRYLSAATKNSTMGA